MKAAAKSFQAARAVTDGSGGGGTFTGGGCCLVQPATATKATASMAATMAGPRRASTGGITSRLRRVSTGATTLRLRRVLRVMITSSMDCLFEYGCNVGV